MQTFYPQDNKSAKDLIIQMFLRDEKEKTLKLENDIQILENQMNLNPTEFIQASLNQKKGELENQRQDIVEGFLSTILGQLA
jgi:hypothetical protein